MNQTSSREIPRPGNPQIEAESFAIFRLYSMVKTLTFMTEDLGNFVLKTEFKEDIPPQLTPRKIFLFLSFNFMSIDNVPPSIVAAPIQIEGAQNPDPDFFNLLNITLVNFDDSTPVYSKEPVYLATIWGKEIHLRVKVQRPYDGANFRDITLTFFQKNITKKESAHA